MMSLAAFGVGADSGKFMATNAIFCRALSQGQLTLSINAVKRGPIRIVCRDRKKEERIEVKNSALSARAAGESGLKVSFLPRLSLDK